MTPRLLSRLGATLVFTLALAPSLLAQPAMTADQRSVWASVETTWTHFATGTLDDALADYTLWHRWGVDTPGLWDVAELREHEERGGEAGRMDDLRLEPVLVEVYGDAAVVHYRAYVTYVYNATGERFPTASRWTDFRVRQGDRWMIVGGSRDGLCQLVGEGERAPEAGNACLERRLDVSDGSWAHETLTASERARYVGAYAETLSPGDDPVPVRVWDEGGVLQISVIPGDDWDEIHLVPMGDHTFAMGRFDNGRLMEVYHPDTLGRFTEANGRVVGYEFVTDDRVRSSAIRTD